MANKTILLLEFALVLLASMGAASAFGVSSPYWNDNPLGMQPGEEKIVSFNLQNMVGDSDVQVKAVLTKGSEIASIEKDIYIVKLGTYDTKVPLAIKIPEDAEIGKVYTIAVEFKTMTPGDNGVAMGIGMSEGFDIIIEAPVAQEAAETAPVSAESYVALTAAVIVLAAFIIAFAAKKKTKKRRGAS